jgi:hypothetical protein
VLDSWVEHQGLRCVCAWGCWHIGIADQDATAPLQDTESFLKTRCLLPKKLTTLTGQAWAATKNPEEFLLVGMSPDSNPRGHSSMPPHEAEAILAPESHRLCHAHSRLVPRLATGTPPRAGHLVLSLSTNGWLRRTEIYLISS